MQGGIELGVACEEISRGASDDAAACGYGVYQLFCA
jgi:hypothetical protein